jgi:hypothetical protein
MVRSRDWVRVDQGFHYGRFKRTDLNRDGKVTRHEARKVKRQVRARDWDRGDQGNHYERFKRSDLNRDGKVTRYEARKVNRQVRARDWDWNRGGQGNGRGMGFAQDHNRK